MTNDDLNLLIQELGPMDESINSVLRLSDAEYVVNFDDVDVDVEYDAPSKKLMMSAQLGVPSAANALKVYEFLMTYALAWRRTGGLGIALTAPGGSLVLTLPLFAVDLTAARLTTIVANLAAEPTC